jgi:hypothetical protein
VRVSTRAAAVHHHRHALVIHAADHAHEPWPGHRGERDLPGFFDEEHGLLAIEDVDLEVEGARQQRAAASSAFAGKHEGRAADERRMLERQRDVVERVQVREALEGREQTGVRIGLESQRPRSDLGAPLGGEAVRDVAVADLRQIEQRSPQQRSRHRFAERIQQDALVLDHFRIQEPRLRVSDRDRVAAQPHLEQGPALHHERLAEAPQPGFAPILAVRNRDHRRLDPA